MDSLKCNFTNCDICSPTLVQNKSELEKKDELIVSYQKDVMAYGRERHKLKSLIGTLQTQLMLCKGAGNAMQFQLEDARRFVNSEMPNVVQVQEIDMALKQWNQFIKGVLKMERKIKKGQ